MAAIPAGKIEVLDHIPIDITVDQVMDRVNLRAGVDKIRVVVQELLAITRERAVPKAVYRTSVARNEGRKLYVDGILLQSYVPLLRFEMPEIVFSYVATCGSEIDETDIPKSEFMRYYLMNLIKEILLFTTGEYLKKHLISTYGLKNLTHIGPGEALGPLRQQKELFDIIGNVEELIGVRLSPHFMMVPEKSTSGMFFETSVEIERCRICPQVKCIARHQPYESEILLKYRNQV